MISPVCGLQKKLVPRKSYSFHIKNEIYRDFLGPRTLDLLVEKVFPIKVSTQWLPSSPYETSTVSLSVTEDFSDFFCRKLVFSTNLQLSEPNFNNRSFSQDSFIFWRCRKIFSTLRLIRTPLGQMDFSRIDGLLREDRRGLPGRYHNITWRTG